MLASGKEPSSTTTSTNSSDISSRKPTKATNFDDPGVGPTKRRKLAWAERLLYWLERRRGERFDVLDGRREAIDRSGLPV